MNIPADATHNDPPPAGWHGAQTTVPPQPPVHQGYYVPAQVVPAPASTNGLAVAALVLGILWIYWVGSILAVIFGHVALAQIGKRQQAGRGLAIAGLVLGWIGVGTFLFVITVTAAAGSGA
jgi:Domain of unknown function (DUF4190)